MRYGRLARLEQALGDQQRKVEELRSSGARRPMMGDGRPAAGAADRTLDHKAAFEGYVRKGDVRRLGGVEE